VKNDLVERFVEALGSELRGFIVDPDLEDPRPLLDAVKKARIGGLLEVHRIEGSRLLYIGLKTKPCETHCLVQECRDRGEECLRYCVEKCLEERARMIRDRLLS
jgi:hypothetical protein